MAAIEIRGSITHITPEVELKGGFKCRFVGVLEPNQNNPKYDNKFQIQVLKDKYPLIDKFHVGAQVKINANVASKEWTNQSGVTSYFVTLGLWKIENTGSAEFSHPESERQAESTGFSSNESNDDPF